MGTSTNEQKDGASIRTAAIGIGLLALAFLSVLAVYAVLEFRATLASNLSLQAQLLDEHEYSHQISVNLGLQSQEWQNVLLRGSDPDAYSFHLQRFYDKGRVTMEKAESLRKLLDGSDPVGVGILNRLLAAHRQASLTFRNGLREIHRSAASPAQAADQFVGDPMQPVEAIVDELHRHMSERANQLTEIQTRRTRNSLLQILLAAWIAIVLALAAGLVRFRQSVTRPLERATNAAQRIASGDLDFVIEGHAGRDVGRLLSSLESMRSTLDRNTRDLKAARDEAEQARDSLEALVRQRTADLQASEARYRRAANLGHIGYWEWDLERQEMIVCSEELAAIYETTVEDVIQRSRNEVGMLSWLHPDDREDYLQTVGNMLNSPGSYSLDLRIVTAKGRIRYVRGTRDTFVGEDGQVRAIGVLQDVTELRLAQQTSAEAKKVEALGRLTGGIAHDMNNILNIISGNLEMVIEDENSTDYLPALRTVSRAADRGAQMTHRLLAFARRQPLAPKPVNLAPVLTGFTDLLRSVLSENIDIELIIDGGLWNCDVDVNQLETVLLNLATNARDAMPEGGTLTVEASNARLDDDYVQTLEGMEPGQYVCISFTDTGTGMPEHVAVSAFEPFFTTKKVGEGTGLGLAMAHGFVKQSGGHIKIYSEVGEGTTIKIYLPRTTKVLQPPTAEPPVSRPLPSGEERTVLVVEDDVDLRNLFTHQIESLGFRALSARNGAEALEILISDAAIDLLLTDVILPGGMSGRDVADRAEEHRPDLPVIFMSGYTRNSVIHNGRLDPDVTLLQKPFRKRDLEKALRRVFEKKEG